MCAMRWEPDVSRGAWIAERTSRAWDGTMHIAVPRGFEAYARVFHPVDAQRPLGMTWQDVRAGDDPDDWDRRSMTWAEAVDAVGLTWHPLVQWERVCDTDPGGGSWNGVPTADGWRLHPPMVGDTSAAVLAVIAGALAEQTSTPERGCAAVWEGLGGLFDDSGFGVLYFGDGPPPPPPPPPLGPEVAAGPRLELTWREHVLFDAGIVEFADASYVRRAPWVRVPDLPSQESPNLLWPEDRAWVVVSEIDWDTTIVGGTAACIADLLALPDLEVAAIPPGADLSIDGDRVNPRMGRPEGPRWMRPARTHGR